MTDDEPTDPFAQPEQLPDQPLKALALVPYTEEEEHKEEAKLNWFQRWFYRPDTRIMLGHDNKVHRLKRKGIMFKDHLGGAYDPRNHGRVWNPYPIPKGFITIYTENNPEPVWNRDPTGWNAQTTEMVTGKKSAQAMFGAPKGSGLAFNFGGRVIGIAVSVLFLIGVVAFVLWRRGAIGG